MAEGSCADISQEDIAGSDGTFWGTMEYWSLRVGPVKFPKCQSAYWALRRVHNMRDDQWPPGEDLSTHGRRLYENYERIHTEGFGEGFKVKALKKDNVSKAKAKAAASVHPSRRTEASAAPTVETRRPPVGSTHTEREMTVFRSYPAAEAASSGEALTVIPGAEMFAIDTPRVP